MNSILYFILYCGKTVMCYSAIPQNEEISSEILIYVRKSNYMIVRSSKLP